MSEQQKRPRRVWQGFEGEDGLQYTLYRHTDKVTFHVKWEGNATNEAGEYEIEMSIEDLKVFIVIGQEMVAEDAGSTTREDMVRG